jgi:hypothetical protein
MERLLAMLIFFAPAWAQVLQVKAAGTPDAVQGQLEAALGSGGLAIEKSLNISHSLAGPGVRFMPFKVVLLRPEKAVQNAIKLNPALTTTLPPAIVLYAPSANQVTLGVVDG